MTLQNECLPQKQAAMNDAVGVQAEASISHFAIADSLAAIACEIDWNHGIPNKTVHVATLHAMAREISGSRVEELYPNDE
jgi:hypothetical protein